MVDPYVATPVAAAEPMTTFVTCLNCNNRCDERWRASLLHRLTVLLLFP